MANKLFLQEHSIKAPRNGFDHSSTRLFSSPVGYLNPIMCKELVQGDYLEESISSLTRTHRLNTAAFARFTEHFDCFFVPTRLLLSNFATWKTSLASLNVNNRNVDILSKKVPSFTFEDFIFTFEDLVRTESSTFDREEVSRVWRLFSLMRTGIDKWFDSNGFLYSQDIDDITTGDHQDKLLERFSKTPISLLPFVAYNRIYNDFYSDSRWEINNNAFGNLEWYWHSNLGNFPSQVSLDFFKLKSANYKRDMFLGLAPSQQYGSTAVVDILSTRFSTLDPSQTVGQTQIQTRPDGAVPNNQGNIGNTSGVLIGLQGELNMLSLRYAQALQRYKEAIGSNLRHLSNQMEAQFGVKLPEMLSQSVEYIDSVYNQISINEVVATADGTSAEGSSSVGQIGGRGFGVQSADKTIKYTAKEDGFFFVIYHVDPDTMYDSFGMDKQLLHLDRDDFYNPSFDKIGLSPIYNWQLDNAANGTDELIGYGARYMEYKTDVDLCFGSFTRNGVNSVYSPHYDNYSTGTDYVDNWWDYRNFKINPNCTDYLFFDDYNGNQPTDPLDICVHHDLKLVRNMYVDTLSF